MRITARKRGSIKNTMGFLKRIMSRSYLRNLEHYGELGVKALASIRRLSKFSRNLCSFF